LFESRLTGENSMRKILLLALLAPLLLTSQGGQAQSDKPMILPIAAAPGPNTWMVGQFYGNTTGAYNFGSSWYGAGQRLHFGIDLFTPCGTPLVAVGEMMCIDLSKGADITRESTPLYCSASLK
jgi:murein DD-endopeptidase MepM/ murein hydrolase activator NlpD